MNEDRIFWSVALVLTLFFGMMLGVKTLAPAIDAKIINHALEVCEPNQGLRRVDRLYAHCANGARFSVEQADE